MSYGRFMSYNVIGGVAWVLLCTLAGYLFGNLPFVQKNFSIVVAGHHRPSRCCRRSGRSCRPAGAPAGPEAWQTAPEV